MKFKALGAKKKGRMQEEDNRGEEHDMAVLYILSHSNVNSGRIYTQRHVVNDAPRDSVTRALATIKFVKKRFGS
ncbi:uncharacterized protein LAJ45_09106 [Morchella importuna]|uniref:uncharacterized protein n=1 Tax=Morchella importuna TaxID=1174673 RepID=UPI001E8EA037|nr:uncharacterized protein LAJ45_09106 [Morchella importuna]KAH8146732.1 hypothetical protein LAJ45_09106 [Morchella importuna]